MDRQRIIFTVTNDLRYDQRMQRICGSLAQAGHRIELMGRKKKNSPPLPDMPFKQTRLNCWFEKGKLFYFEYNVRLFFRLLFRSCDSISAVDLDTLLPCTLVCVIKQKKLYFDAHEYFTEVPEVSERKMVKAIWETVARLCIRHAHKAYTVGPILADLFTKKYNNPFEVIRNVPARHQHETGNVQAEKIIFYQGALNEGRGLEESIEAMRYVNARLLIAGEGDLSSKLRELCRKEGLEHKVSFLGYKTPEELKALTANAWLGLNLLQAKGLSYYYSLANKFFDYMHAGVPCLCADFPEYQAIQREYECGILCDCKVEDIVKAIQKLMHDEGLYQKLQQNCINAREELNWETEEQKLLQIYS